MVFFVAFSMKSAITIGALIGGSVALYSNREAIMEYLVTQWEEINHELSREKIKMACNMEDGELSVINDSDDKLTFRDGEMTTPDTSDTEEYHDLDGWDDSQESDFDLCESSFNENEDAKRHGLRHRTF